MNFRLFSKAAVSMLGLAALCFCPDATARKLVILHTNDIHSAVEPDINGQGGMLQIKEVFDSVRRADKDVITVDAGDFVQGSLYFKYFRGDVEYPLMDMIGYDIRVLGNHEFDNGMEDLGRRYRQVKGDRLSANYDFTGSPMEGVMKPYVIKKIGGRKIGFIGLNVQPEGLIFQKNIGMKYSDPIEVGNWLASYLKNEKKCDLVVAVTHIGYAEKPDAASDMKLAQESRDIDIIIGGHSHTLVDPANPRKTPSVVKNLDGRNVYIGQTGKNGRFVGKMTIDLDHLKDVDGEDVDYELIAVGDRYPQEQLNKEMREFLQPWKEKVEASNKKVIGKAAYDMRNDVRVGGLANMTADIGFDYLRHKADSLRNAGVNVPDPDLGIMNVGGIRQNMPEGDVTEGQILSTYPFSNYYTLIELKGSDIVEAMRSAALKGGECVSRNVRVVTDSDKNLVRMIVDGEEIDPEKHYVVATINYIAEGNDNMPTLARHRKLWTDDNEVCVGILRWYERQGKLGLPLQPDPSTRFVEAVKIP